MKALPLLVAGAVHAAALVAAGWIEVNAGRGADEPWSDGRVNLSLAERATASADVVAVAPAPAARDVVPAPTLEKLTPPETGSAADGDETVLDLPEGGCPPPAPSICVDGGASAPARPKFSLYAKPGGWTSAGRIGRGRRGATGVGDGTAMQASAAPVAAPAPVSEPVFATAAREPERVEPKIVDHPQPRYPESARVRRIQGVVRLEVEVLEDGAIGEIRVVESSGSELLDDAAVAGIRKWRFAAATVDGEAVRAVVALPPIRFKLT